MSRLADRAEHIAAHLVSRALGARAVKHDEGGRQAAVDCMLEWPDGRRGSLEVTLITDPRSAPWQGLAAKDGWRWPSGSGWTFRLNGSDMPYRRTKQVAARVTELCDRWSVESPEELPREVLVREPNIPWLASIGDLRRTSLHSGIAILPEMRAGFIDLSKDFVSIVERWLDLPHIQAHIAKAASVPNVHERHLFIVPVDDVLPPDFFTNDFPPPRRTPDGFGTLDGLWVWSNYWHQFLALREGRWDWLDLPGN